MLLMTKDHHGRDGADRVKFLPTTRRIAQFSSGKTPTADDVVVYIDGTFDLCHGGHIEAFEAAKKLGTFLLVGIHRDDDVNKMKGRNYPIMNLHERILGVLSVRLVDEVVMGAPVQISADMIKSFNISVVVHGSHHDPDSSVGDIDPYKYVTVNLL
jgi:ethanolamine-phosphate cytidylyltransferase